ncbi:hypothetical protein ASF28_18625 [Methylobacterium sp. Leaf99]|uniref:hypothetical protein n=1 Tax=Methylobacterium sp. Leaf99 TaxID=1736251 RepID=UPI0006F4B27E|nr:hypothetical protein [Methylobacterium sp. Leaf99]KQP05904.1 hypothetical protein ASF28_18625 [Methylobacterium sp. Leaf99]
MPARMRVIEITRIVQDRHQGPCATDDAIIYLDEVLPHFATKCGSAGFMFAVAEWVAQNCPRLTGADIEDAVARILPNPPRYTSVAIGRRLNVRIAEARRLGLRYVRPVGWNAAKHERQAKAAKAAALRVKRQATGKTRTPRALSVEKLAPWIALEMSRATFKRLPKDMQADHVERAREALR